MQEKAQNNPQMCTGGAALRNSKVRGWTLDDMKFVAKPRMSIHVYSYHVYSSNRRLLYMFPI